MSLRVSSQYWPLGAKGNDWWIAQHEGAALSALRPSREVSAAAAALRELLIPVVAIKLANTAVATHETVRLRVGPGSDVASGVASGVAGDFASDFASADCPCRAIRTVVERWRPAGNRSWDLLRPGGYGRSE